MLWVKAFFEWFIVEAIRGIFEDFTSFIILCNSKLVYVIACELKGKLFFKKFHTIGNCFSNGVTFGAKLELCSDLKSLTYNVCMLSMKVLLHDWLLE